LGTLTVEKKDGRVLRGERNHRLIVDAIYRLIRAGNASPSVQEVAAAAGVGERTIFRQFKDLETLSQSVSLRVQSEVAQLIAPRVPTGRWQEDLRAEIEQRARIFEHVAPFRRASGRVRHRVAFLQSQDVKTAKMLRASIEDIFRPHLRRNADELMEALDAMLSFEVWERLRDRQRLSAARAVEVLNEAASALMKSGA
jgi:AcrR family transcriptional regulator